MNKAVKILTGIAATAAIAAGCSRQDPVVTDGAPLSFSIAGQTKADNRKTSITEFTVRGFGNGGEWFPQTSVTVPSGTFSNYRWRSGDTHTFYAFSNLPQSSIATASIQSTGVTLNYTAVPEAQAGQQDILLGSYSGMGNEGRATLHFYHPLASVAFKVGNISDVKSINLITLKGVYANGSVTLSETSGTPAFAWTHAGTRNVNQTVTVSSFTSDTKIGDPFILIPQEAASGVTLELSITDTGNQNRTIVCGLTDVDWKYGQTCIYTVDYIPGKGLNITSSVSNWVDGDPLPDKDYDY